jgi:hypothetical protein
VGDYHSGNIYHFKLNEDRTEFMLNGPLADKVGDKANELEDIKFGEGFGGVTDLQTGTDGYLGYLYVVSIS